MRGRLILEICVETAATTGAAERGGAQRIELCRRLDIGGLTPSAEMMRAVREQVRLPVFAMIRPRGGDFVYSDDEFESMRRDLGNAKQLGINGLVLGILTADGEIDVERTRRLVELAQPLPVTFHRAFDECADLRKSLEDAMDTGVTRVLTSGGAATVPEGLATLAELVAIAGDRIVVMPGSGINPSNIAWVAEQTRAREFHSGLSSVPLGANSEGIKFEAEVRKLAKALNDLDRSTD